MLGVNVAKSSLHLYLLKTLEFRTDVSVTSMPGVASVTGASHFPPPSSHGDPRSETQSNSLPSPINHAPFEISPFSIILGTPCQDGLCVSALLRGPSSFALS